MANKLSPKDFTYYFAVESASYTVYGPYLQKQAVLISYVYLNGKKAAEPFKTHTGPVMLDSGGFTNFIKPGTVKFEEWLEFVKANKWFHEVVQFDDLRSRANTIKHYETAVKAGVSSLFVDHLWFKQRPATVDQLWKSQDKLCISGFGKTLPGQEKFPGDPASRFADAMKRADDDDTHVHLLAAGSLRRFLPHINRIHSVDSAGWDKSAAFGIVRVFGFDELKGVKVPVLRGYRYPGTKAEDSKSLPKELRKLAWDNVVAANKWDKESNRRQATLVSLYHSKMYAKALTRFVPDDLNKALADEKEGKAIQKMLDDGSASGMFFPTDIDPFDSGTPDTGWSASPFPETKAAIPSDGLVLAPPSMAEAVVKGEKKLIVKSRSLDIAEQSLVLISQRKALGIVTLGEMKQISDDEFTVLEPDHLITAETRKSWAEVQPSWAEGPLYSWTVASVEKFDVPRDTNVNAGPQVLVHDVEVRANLAEKIKDPGSYDPKDANDDQLRDDFRILLAWYSTWKRDPEAFVHSLETIETLLRKVIKELVRRGPDVIQFNPRGMAPSVRSFFRQVARDVKVPETMFKALSLEPGTDPEELTVKELVLAHWVLHEMFAKESVSQQGVAGWSTEDIVNLHSRVVDRLYELKVEHPAPPDNGLDELSMDFESHHEGQPDWHKRPEEKMTKADYATVNRSGKKRGPVIKMADVLKYFKTFKARRPFVYLVGGLANHGETEGDIDILINDGAETPEWLKDVIHFRLGRALPGPLAKRLQIHFDRDRGPFTNHVELYDLHLERIDGDEVKEMRDVEKQEPRAASPRFRQQADRAAREDKLRVGEFFYQPKPTRPAMPEQLQTVESLLKLYRDHDEWLPTYVQKKYDGANHQIHKDGDTVHIFSEDGDDNTDRLPGVVEAIKKLKPKKLIAPAEVEMWDGRQHLPRESVAGYLNSKDPADDSSIVANIYDVIFLDDDIHKEPTSKRIEALKELGIDQNTMGAPNLRHRLNMAPSVKADDLEELERAVQRIRRLPGSEGAVLKQVDAPYPPKKVTPNTWVKFHNATTIRGTVIGKTRTEGNVWVYQYGVLPGRDDAQKTVEVEGTELVPVGDTFGTKRNLSRGDGILVEAETVNLERSPKGIKLTAWVPRVIGEYTGRADTVDRVTSRAKSNLVLQEKDVDEGGEITYRPTDKVEKQQDPYLEVPPEGPKYRYSVQHHWRGKSVHSDLRMVLKPRRLLLGWTMNTQRPGVVKEPVTTLAEARKWSSSQNMDKISKIDWNTGEWAERPRRGTDKLVRTEILSERKAPEPFAWLDVEGKTRDPEPGKAPPVGGTRNHPGVFDLVDQGTVEYGAQKPWFHEYFFTGDALNYRMFFRQLRISVTKNEEPCQACEQVVAKSIVGWVGDENPVALCDDCTTEFLRKVDVVLPPSEEQGLPGAAWLAIYPDDQTPYVLSNDAVKKNWMPSDGRSALPGAVRSQIPDKFRYWTKRGATAKKTRDELFEAIKAKEVEVDYSETFKATKASLLDADFVLQEQTWRGPVQVRVGPTRTRWWIRLDVGRPELVTLELQRNPLDNKEVTAFMGRDRHKESMKLTGTVAPGHYLNPTKETPSNIEALDRGKAEVLSISDDLIKVRFKGPKLKGLFVVKRNNGEFLWSPSAEASETTEKRVQFEMFIPFDHVRIEKKAGEEKRLVTGIALEPNVVDAQGDTISEDAIEKAAHDFLRDYNKGTELGIMHRIFGDIGIELVESYVTPTAFTIGSTKKKNVKKGSWVVTVHVTSDKRWKQVKDGQLTGFSVGGMATVKG